MDRRRFVGHAANLAVTVAMPLKARASTGGPVDHVTLFLCGDVMTGRGIDQVLPHPGDPRLFEPYLRTAGGYVELAEARNGPISRPVSYSYVWGDALEELGRVAPDARIINLETSVTTSDQPWPGKPVLYRMHPANVPCLTAAAVDCCVLANNHVLDWGIAGLMETLETLHGAGIKTAGAGRDDQEAGAPAVLATGTGTRVLVYAFAATTSGVPALWAAQRDRPGVTFMPDLSQRTVHRIAEIVLGTKRRGDVVVVSIHWGGNWGYHVPREQREFAHGLIDQAGVDVIHGHSSHHPKGIEVYRDRPILYGCGDFLNDYEGISGYEEFRGDLALMYLPTINPSDGTLVRFRVTPFQVRRFRLNWAAREDAQWLRDRLSREGAALGTRVELGPNNTLVLRWT